MDNIGDLLRDDELTDLRHMIKSLQHDKAELEKNNFLLGSALQEIKQQRTRLEEQQRRILHELSEELTELEQLRQRSERLRRILEMTLPYVRNIGPVARAIERVLNES